jgi:hypothetical protein
MVAIARTTLALALVATSVCKIISGIITMGMWEGVESRYLDGNFSMNISILFVAVWSISGSSEQTKPLYLPSAQSAQQGRF